MTEQPPNPNWTSFFDRQVVRQYQDFVRDRDPAKRNLPPLDYDTRPDFDTSQPENGHISTPPPVPEYSRVIFPHGRNKKKQKEFKSQRGRRTFSCVIFGVLMIGVLALLAGFLIHFLFIDKGSQAEFLIGSPERNNNTGRKEPSMLLTTASSSTINFTATTAKPTTARPTTTIITTTPSTTTSTSKPVVVPIAPKTLQSSEIFSVAVTRPKSATTATPTTTATLTTTPKPIKAILTLNNVSVSLGEPASLICNLLQGGAWKTLSILQIKPAFSLLVTLHAGANKTNTWPDKRLRSAFVIVENGVELLLVITKTRCTDHGVYRCSAELENGIIYDTQEVIINEPFVQPVVKTLPYLIEKELATISANWTLGPKYTQGKVTWEVKAAHDTEYTPVEVNDFTQPTRLDCSTQFTNTFVVFVEMKFNNSYLRIRIESVYDENGVAKSYVSPPVYLLVIPAGLCRGRVDDSLIKHPYTCTQFIQCKNQTMSIYGCRADECFIQSVEACMPVPRLVQLPKFG
ncbi:hypothetical protein LOTGIDRAFT_236408 [Lottia gigantea]|uniref:Ig-like domain-containing protein n=1 Tax=Lottia gigantea TaxID=225164 RepID=V3ZHM8_LOTGI|nr:hypothetical protein LOTGIDRAFT_236408 [Lottia gigantea]ESO83712.1 hypothetical protein LOTGIDRAFT_236408 [Lottia gigantea]